VTPRRHASVAHAQVYLRGHSSHHGSSFYITPDTPNRLALHIFQLNLKGPPGQVNLAQTEGQRNQHKEQSQAKEHFPNYQQTEKEHDDQADTRDQTHNPKALHPANQRKPRPKILNLPANHRTPLLIITITAVQRTDYIGVEQKIIHGDNMAKFWILPVRLAVNTGFPSKELRQIEKLVEENKTVIERKWNEFFSRS